MMKYRHDVGRVLPFLFTRRSSIPESQYQSGIEIGDFVHAHGQSRCVEGDVGFSIHSFEYGNVGFERDGGARRALGGEGPDQVGFVGDAGWVGGVGFVSTGFRGRFVGTRRSFFLGG